MLYNITVHHIIYNFVFSRFLIASMGSVFLKKMKILKEVKGNRPKRHLNCRWARSRRRGSFGSTLSSCDAVGDVGAFSGVVDADVVGVPWRRSSSSSKPLAVDGRDCWVGGRVTAKRTRTERVNRFRCRCRCNCSRYCCCCCSCCGRRGCCCLRWRCCCCCWNQQHRLRFSAQVDAIWHGRFGTKPDENQMKLRLY